MHTKLGAHFSLTEAALRQQGLTLLGQRMRDDIVTDEVRIAIRQTCILVLQVKPGIIPYEVVRKIIEQVIETGRAQPDQMKTLQCCLNLVRNFYSHLPLKRPDSDRDRAKRRKSQNMPH